MNDNDHHLPISKPPKTAVTTNEINHHPIATTNEINLHLASDDDKVYQQYLNIMTKTMDIFIKLQ